MNEHEDPVNTKVTPQRRCILNQVTIILICSVLGSAGVPLPLRISENQRHFVDQNGSPFLMHGDSPWSLFVALTKEEVDIYLEDRRRKGFNVLLCQLIENEFKGADNPYGSPTNRYGHGPFTTPGDFSTPNELYFQHADWVIDRAAEKGFVLLLTPCYLGYPNTSEGWYEESMQNTLEANENFGRFVGERYRDKTNILWIMSGDRNSDDARTRIDAMANGIRASTPNHLFSAHTQRTFDSRAQFGDSAWHSFNSVYPNPETLVMQCLTNYSRLPAMPAFMLEGWYEGEHGMTEQRLRGQAYQALLGGMCGQIFGNRPIWLFDTGWQAALDSRGARTMQFVKTLFDSRPWHLLEPDVQHDTVVSGYGSPGVNYVSAARTSDGNTVIAYLPSEQSISIDMSRVSGSHARIWWYDPRTGVASNPATYPTIGISNFVSPSNDDWILVLENESLERPPPGSRIISISTQAHTPSMLATQGFHFTISATMPSLGVIQVDVSTNLQSWHFLTNVSHIQETTSLLDPTASNSPSRSYRAVIPASK